MVESRYVLCSSYSGDETQTWLAWNGIAMGGKW
jgi:hypothetical protein